MEVGYTKHSLPLKVRDNLAFDESVVVRFKFGSKTIYIILLYKSPALKDGFF